MIKPFNWESVESSDYKQYIANLRAVGCPEENHPRHYPRGREQAL